MDVMTAGEVDARPPLLADKWKCLSHSERRKFCKKRRRHHKRVSIAREREAKEQEALRKLQSSPGYFDRLKEEARLEEERERKEEIERQYQHELWLRRETLAQVEFKKKKQAEERVAKAREERERLIREEWEALQSKEKEEDDRKAVERERKEALLQEALTIDQQEPAESWRNPLAPSSANSSDTRQSQSSVDFGTERDAVNCSFFLKTGACRFGDRCSRSHPRLTSSSTLLIPNMFQDISLVEQALEDRDNDVSLEFEEGELYERFKAFYDDVLPEFQRIGRVIQFKVCCNHEPHLRGNVYVQFSSEAECTDAYKAFNGRWYAMRQLSCQFCPVVKWKTAICGQFQRRCCPKGKKCNFLHVFSNPGNTFWRADRDLPPPPSIEDRHRWNERRGSGYRQQRRSVSPRRPRRWSHRHTSTSSSSSRRRRRSSSRSGTDSSSDMETDTHHRSEKAGSSQRSSSVASNHSSREHKRRSSQTQDDSYHGNHRHRRHGSRHSNSHDRKRDSGHLSGEDSDHRKEKKSKGKKKHRHSHEDGSPKSTRDNN